MKRHRVLFKNEEGAGSQPLFDELRKALEVLGVYAPYFVGDKLGGFCAQRSCPAYDGFVTCLSKNHSDTDVADIEGLKDQSTNIILFDPTGWCHANPLIVAQSNRIHFLLVTDLLGLNSAKSAYPTSRVRYIGDPDEVKRVAQEIAKSLTV